MNFIWIDSHQNQKIERKEMPLNNVKRPDLSIPYKHVPVAKTSYSSSSQGILSQSMPMAAMFMKNKFLAWFALLTTFHYYLTAEPSESNSPEQSPIVKIGMSVVSLLVCYMGLALPQSVSVPPKKAEKAA